MTREKGKVKLEHLLNRMANCIVHLYLAGRRDGWVEVEVEEEEEEEGARGCEDHTPRRMQGILGMV